MVEINSGEYNQGSILGAICSFGAIFCMVVAVLGIKFKWFKRRLDLQQVPSNDGRESRHRGQSNDDILSRGVFRKRFEDEIIIEADKSKTLPPIRIRSSIRDFKIPLPHEANSTGERPASQPSRPTIPPPTDIPRSVSTGVITNINYEETQKNSAQNGETNTKQLSFQKKEVMAKKIPSKYDSHSSSVNDEQSAQRRPTGVFLSEQVNTDDSFVRNYTEGFGLSNKSPSIKYDSVATEGSQDNEIDLFAKMRMPKPEPRTTVPTTQSKKQLEMTGYHREDTEA